MQAPSFDVGIGGMVQQFAMGMAQQMQQMQGMQQQMLQALQGRSVEMQPIMSPPPAAAGSLLMLSDSSNRFLRRAQSRFALTDANPVAETASNQDVPAAGRRPPEQVPAAEVPGHSPPTAVEVQLQVAAMPRTVEAAASAMIAAMAGKATKRKAEASKDNADEPVQKSPKRSASGKKAAEKAVPKVPVKKDKATTSAKAQKAAPDVKKESARNAMKAAPAKVEAKKPQVGHEASRNQFMCRTGLSGAGQTLAFRYDPSKRGSLEAAKVKSERWLKAEKQKRGCQ